MYLIAGICCYRQINSNLTAEMQFLAAKAVFTYETVATVKICFTSAMAFRHTDVVQMKLCTIVTELSPQLFDWSLNAQLKLQYDEYFSAFKPETSMSTIQVL